MTTPGSELAPAPAYTPPWRVRRPRGLRHLKSLIHVVLRAHLIHQLVDRSVCELRFADPATGRRITVPVWYAHAGNTLITLVTPADTGRWWLIFQRPQPVQVLVHRKWHNGHARMLTLGQAGWREARQIHNDRYAHHPVDDADVLVIVSFDEPTYPAG